MNLKDNLCTCILHTSVTRVFQYSRSFVKRLATIFLVHEFIHIMKEAREIFSYYRINGGCPPIEEIPYDQDEIRKLKSADYAAYNENLRKKGSPIYLD